jgi:hypothetical protein
MTDELIKLALQNGGQAAFLVLFVWLFIDTRKEAQKREEQLMRMQSEMLEELHRIGLSLEKQSAAFSELAFVRKINE